MIIGIDTRLYGTKHGGIGRYIKELILNLLKIDRENQYVFFVYNDKDKEAIKCDLQKCLSDKISFITSQFRWYSIKEQIMMPTVIKKTGIDLMHFPHFNVPMSYNDPYVSTIHDLIIHHFPDERATTLPLWLYRLKLIGYKKVIKRAVKNARVIIAPSEFTKNDILKFYKIEAAKIKIVHEGVDLKSKCQMSNVKSNPNVKCQNLNNYLLYVGSVYPHKNLEKLVDAFVILRNKYKVDVKLVLVGKIDYFYNQLQKYIISKYPNINYLISNIVFYGYADDSELAQLYKNAKLFVFPSLYEGFGLPPLEAMSFGTPVAASNLSSIPEVCGDAAVYFDPNDIDEIVEKIYPVIASEAKQSLLRQKGFDQIKKYSWTKMAQETLQIYKNML